MSSPIRIELFGELRVAQGDLVTSRFATQKAAALLAYLAYHQGQSHSREALASLFWRESEASSARNSLSTALWSLRRLLNPHDETPDPVLFTDRSSVSIIAGSIATDVSEFEEVLARAERSSSLSERISLYEAGLRLWRTPLLSGFYEDWISIERERLERKYAFSCQRLAQLYVETGGFENAIAWAREVVQIDPFHEESHLNLMRILVSAGRLGDAVLHYQEMERLFKKEMATSPSKELRQYVETIREDLSAPTNPAALTSSAPLKTPPASPQSELVNKSEVSENAVPLIPKSRPVANVRTRQGMQVFSVALVLMALFVVFRTQSAAPIPTPQSPARSQITDFRPAQPKNPQTTLPPVATPTPTNQVKTAPQFSGSPTAPATVFVSEPLPKPKPAPAKFLSEGKTLWAQRYESLEDEKDSEPTSVKADANGNIYVCGFVQTLHNDVDFLVVKYSSDGKLLWRQRWNGPGNDCDRARCMALDSRANVYVTGESYNGDREKGGRDWDIALVKFDTNGVKQWENLYNGGKWDDDRAIGVCVDTEDKVYLGGVSHSPDHKAEYVLLKYDKDGRALFPQPITYSSPAAGHEDVDIGLEDFVVDAKGSLYLMAEIVYTRKSGDNYCLIAKYDYHGNQIWMRRFSGEAREGDKGRKIALDSTGNIFVTGVGFTPNSGRQGTGEDIFVVKYDTAGNEIWKTYYRDELTPGIPDGLAIDAEGSVLVSGTMGAPHKIHVALKFNTEGKLAWKRRYPTYGVAIRLQGIVADSTNSAYVIGKACDTGATKSSQALGDIVATKYSPSGEILWQRAYLGPTADQGKARALLIQKDQKGSIFSLGQSQGKRFLDMVVIKYSP